MGEKTAGAPQETFADVMLDMICDTDGTADQEIARTPGWMAACKHYHDRLSRAARPKLPELDITNLPAGSIAVVVPMQPVTSREFKDVRDVLQHVASDEVRFAMLPHGVSILSLTAGDLARLGLQRIPAA